MEKRNSHPAFPEDTGGHFNLAFNPDPDEKFGNMEDSPSKLSPSSPVMSYGENESRRMMKNVIIISIGFTFLFTAFQAMAALQSSFYEDDGLGTWSLTTLYAALVVSCMFLPTYLIRTFTVKWTLVFAMFGYAVYISMQFHPRFFTLIPGAIVVGICAAPLWSAKCTYLTHLGHQYARLTNQNPEVVITRFFGIFFLAFQSSQIWGNLISSLILGMDPEEPDRSKLDTCGINYCPGQKSDNETEGGSTDKIGTDPKFFILAGIYLGCALFAAAIIALLVDPLIRYGEKEREGASSQLSGLNLLTATVRHMKNPYQILIIPLTVWSGLEQGFFSADYTSAFITCSWGVHRIGYVLICYGAVDALGSFSIGTIIKYTGRIPVFLFGAVVNIATLIVLILWKPDPENGVAVYYVVAGLWGLSDAVWQCQINSYYGVLFPQDEEAAFSNYRLWESIGFIIAYIMTSTNVCVRPKLYMLIGVVTLGMIGFLAVEFIERKKRRKAVT